MIQSEQGRIQSGQGMIQSEQGRMQSGQGRIQSEQGRIQSGQGRIQAGQGRIQSGQNREIIVPSEKSEIKNMMGKFRIGWGNHRQDGRI